MEDLSPFAKLFSAFSQREGSLHVKTLKLPTFTFIPMSLLTFIKLQVLYLMKVLCPIESVKLCLNLIRLTLYTKFKV